MGPVQVPCAYEHGSRKVLVPWPKGLQKPKSVVRNFADPEQEGFSPSTEKQRKSSPGSASLSYELCHAHATQAAPPTYLISSHCKTSLCIPEWWIFLFSHPMPAHQPSWPPQFCVLWPFLWHCIWQAAPQCSGTSWTLTLGLEKCTAQRESSTPQWLVFHIHTAQSSWGSFMGFWWTGGFHTSIIPSQRADFHFKHLAALKRGFSTYTEFISVKRGSSSPSLYCWNGFAATVFKVLSFWWSNTPLLPEEHCCTCTSTAMGSVPVAFSYLCKETHLVIFLCTKYGTKDSRSMSNCYLTYCIEVCQFWHIVLKCVNFLPFFYSSSCSLHWVCEHKRILVPRSGFSSEGILLFVRRLFAQAIPQPGLGWVPGRMEIQLLPLQGGQRMD